MSTTEPVKRFLTAKGYEILAEGYHDCDIVAKDGDDIVYCDVYTYGDTPEAPSVLTSDQIVRIRATDAAWRAEHVEYADSPARYDIVKVMVIGENQSILRHVKGFDSKILDL